MGTLFFMCALVGGIVGAKANGGTWLQSIGMGFILALIFAALFKYVFGL